MLRLSNRLIIAREKSSRKIILKDEQGHEVVSNWPRVFGPGVHKTGPKAGLPKSENTWHLGNNLTKGRATTFRTESRWPKPDQIMPLRKKLPQPLEVSNDYMYFHQKMDFRKMRQKILHISQIQISSPILLVLAKILILFIIPNHQKKLQSKELN